jgi:predicted HicB family RNase H-like nuclease
MEKQGVETPMKETLTFHIEKDLKIELKVLAVRQEKSLTQLLNEIITDYINENK